MGNFRGCYKKFWYCHEIVLQCGKWNGLMDALVNKKTDMVLSALKVWLKEVYWSNTVYNCFFYRSVLKERGMLTSLFPILSQELLLWLPSGLGLYLQLHSLVFIIFSLLELVWPHFYLLRTFWHQFLDACLSSGHSSCCTFHFSVWVVFPCRSCYEGCNQIIWVETESSSHLCPSGVPISSRAQVLLIPHLLAGMGGTISSIGSGWLSSRTNGKVASYLFSPPSRFIIMIGSCPVSGHFLLWSSWPYTQLTWRPSWFLGRSITTYPASRIRR